MSRIDFPEFEQRGSSNKLVVLLHAYMSGPQHLRPVRNIVAEQFPDADLFTPSYPAYWHSMSQPEEIVASLLRRVDQLWMKNSGKYESIILVGHSLGALLARKLYVCACGEPDNRISFEPELQRSDLNTHDPRDWAQKVDRLILLAGMNRGWRITHHLSLLNAVIWSLGVLFGNLVSLFTQRRALIMTIHKGAPFITQLRVQWIHMRNRAADRRVGNALTIQLLGSVDDMVSPEDNIDLSSGRDFVYLDVPFSGHANVIEMDSTKSLPTKPNDFQARDRTVGDARKAIFESALIKSKDELNDLAIIPSDLPVDQQYPDVTDVVFIIHGIRDAGYWTHKVARRILRRAHEENLKVRLATETSSYGYFPMLPFLFPATRRNKVEWLMDRYSEALALYPNAEFSFVGHSNGTYLLGRALREYPVCRFKNVVLAGSVIRIGYDWTKVSGQVNRVLNFVASRDWVVAFFPRAIQILKLQDLGSAGHDGFRNPNSVPELVSQVRYIRGGHGAALVEANWDSIAKFVLTGELNEVAQAIKTNRRNPLVSWPGFVAPLIWVGIAFCTFWIGQLIWSLDYAEWTRTLLMAGYVLCLWKIVTAL